MIKNCITITFKSGMLLLIFCVLATLLAACISTPDTLEATIASTEITPPIPSETMSHTETATPVITATGTVTPVIQVTRNCYFTWAANVLDPNVDSSAVLDSALQDAGIVVDVAQVFDRRMEYSTCEEGGEIVSQQLLYRNGDTVSVQILADAADVTEANFENLVNDIVRTIDESSIFTRGRLEIYLSSSSVTLIWQTEGLSSAANSENPYNEGMVTQVDEYAQSTLIPPRP